MIPSYAPAIGGLLIACAGYVLLKCRAQHADLGSRLDPADPHDGEAQACRRLLSAVVSSGSPSYLVWLEDLQKHV